MVNRSESLSRIMLSDRFMPPSDVLTDLGLLTWQYLIRLTRLFGEGRVGGGVIRVMLGQIKVRLRERVIGIVLNS